MCQFQTLSRGYPDVVRLVQDTYPARHSSHMTFPLLSSSQLRQKSTSRDACLRCHNNTNIKWAFYLFKQTLLLSFFPPDFYIWILWGDTKHISFWFALCISVTATVTWYWRSDQLIVTPFFLLFVFENQLFFISSTFVVTSIYSSVFRVSFRFSSFLALTQPSSYLCYSLILFCFACLLLTPVKKSCDYFCTNSDSGCLSN